MDEISSHAECNSIPTRYSHLKLKPPHRKASQGLRALSYICPSLWNNQYRSLKSSVSLNAFKYNIKGYYFWKGNKKYIYNNPTTNYLFIVSKSLLIFVTVNSLLYF